MQKLSYLLLLISNFWIGVYAQTLPVVFEDWNSQEGTQNFFVRSVTATDASNNIYVAGATINAQGNYDILLAKYKSDGTFEWASQYAGQGAKDDAATAIAIRGSIIYVTGHVFNTPTDSTSLVLLKYDSDGNLIWDEIYNTNNALADAGTSIFLQSVGLSTEIYVGGVSVDTLGNVDFLALKYNESGGLIWSKLYDHAGYIDLCHSIRVRTVFGNITVTMAGASQISATDWRYLSVTLNGSNGNVTGSTSSTGGSAVFSKVTGVERDAAGDIYITGSVYNMMSGYDFYTVKINASNTNVVWDATYNSSGTLNDEAMALAVDSVGNVYVTGYSETSTQGTNYTTIKYDSNGSELWVKNYNASSNGADTAKAIVLHPNGSVVIGGTTFNGLNFDIQLLLLDTNGNKVYEVGYNNENNTNDYLHDLCLNQNDNIIVSGQSSFLSSYYYNTISFKIDSFLFDNNYIIGNDSIPICSENYYIVKFNKNSLKLNNVNNKNIEYGNFSTFLNDSLISILSSKFFSNNPDSIYLTKKLNLRKIFRSMTQSDSVSVSRNGLSVNVPSFWAAFVAKKPDKYNLEQTLDSIKNITNHICYAHPNYVGMLHNIPNDSLYSMQHSLNSTLFQSAHVNVEGAWGFEIGKPYIRVGVYDSGIDTLHEDIRVKERVSCLLYPYNNFCCDNVGHGTAVSGIISAKRNNNNGVSGIAGGDDLVNDSLGISLIDFSIAYSSTFFVDAAAEGIVLGATHNSNYINYLNDIQGYGKALHIMNHSWGAKINDVEPGDSIPDIYGECILCNEAIEYAFKNGVVNIASRGNSGNNNPNILKSYQYPACVKDEFVLNIGASGIDGYWKNSSNGESGNPNDSYFSKYGFNVDVIAPGSTALVKTTQSTEISGNHYRNFNGTSAAAPHVTGAVSLMLSHVNKPCPSIKNLLPEDVEYIIQLTATDVGLLNYDSLNGYGRLNIFEALLKVQEPHFQIIHVNNSPVSKNITLIDSNAVIYLKSPYAYGPLSQTLYLPNGPYYAKIYRIDAVYDHSNVISHLNNSFSLLDAWALNSASNGWGYHNSIYNGNNYIFDTLDVSTNIFLDTIATNNASLHSYIYEIKNDFSYTTFYNNLFLPVDTNNIKMRYSLYVFDSLANTVPYYPCDTIMSLTDKEKFSQKNLFNSLNIYPNPATDNLLISYNSFSMLNTTITIYNQYGLMVKRIQDYSVEGENARMIDISSFSNGMYLLNISSNDFYISSKFIITK